MAGPVGWAIAGVAVLASGISIIKGLNDKKRLEDIFTLISERDVTSYRLAVVELNERILRIKDETRKLHSANDDIRGFGLDYNKMTEKQQFILGSYVNLMLASTRLLVNPILGLQPKYSERDFDAFVSYETDADKLKLYTEYKELIISLANLLYKIEMDDKDKKLLLKSFKKNKKMLEALDISKKDLNVEVIDTVTAALQYKYTASETEEA